MFPWGVPFTGEPEPKPAPEERPDGMKLARHYQALLDSGKFESRAALARHLGVSRARVTQVLKRLNANPMAGEPG
jgi:Mn-dependent DtxR family transcriptional regulator